jgi:hypothetical protein
MLWHNGGSFSQESSGKRCWDIKVSCADDALELRRDLMTPGELLATDTYDSGARFIQEYLVESTCMVEMQGNLVLSGNPMHEYGDARKKATPNVIHWGFWARRMTKWEYGNWQIKDLVKA